MKKPTRLFDFPYFQLDNHPLEKAFVTKYKGEWTATSTEEFIDLINQASRGLLELGIQKGQKVSVITDRNRTEWNILDLALLQIGAVVVPIYPTLSFKDYIYILNHSEVQYCFISNQSILDNLKQIKSETPLKKILSFDSIKGYLSWEELMKMGHPPSRKKELEQLKSAVNEKDLATIIYTSGTTGKPKGVMLSHKNIVSNVKDCGSRVPFEYGKEKALSFLPCCHVFERTLLYIYQYYSVSVYFAESLKTIGENIKEVHPTVMTGVPRVIEKTYEKIWKTGQKAPRLQKRIFNWAVKLGENYEFYGQNSWFYKLKLSLARKLVFSKWKSGLGGNLNIIVSGSAPMQVRLIRIFAAAEILVLEGYGLSETSPVVSVNNPENKNLKLGSVGKPIENEEVRIAKDGEILIRGSNIMEGYYKDREKTKEAMTADGFFKTGDIGELDENNFLSITGRKKKIFKTSGGKYVVPDLIETELKKSPFIQQILVIGEGQKMPAAIIQPDFEVLGNWAQEHQLSKTIKDLIHHKEVLQLYKKEIAHLQQSFSHWEQVKKFELTQDQWSIQNGQLTPTLKVKPHVVLEQYQNLYRKIYG